MEVDLYTIYGQIIKYVSCNQQLLYMKIFYVTNCTFATIRQYDNKVMYCYEHTYILYSIYNRICVL